MMQFIFRVEKSSESRANLEGEKRRGLIRRFGRDTAKNVHIK